MSSPSSNAASEAKNKGGLIRALIVFATLSCTVLVLWALRTSQIDPYVKATVNLQGSIEKGSRLFRMNCAGCHGINAQGLVGPNLQKVSSKFTKAQIINQVVKGNTPPMPSFQLEPQSMADLLAYLNAAGQS